MPYTLTHAPGYYGKGHTLAFCRGSCSLLPRTVTSALSVHSASPAAKEASELAFCPYACPAARMLAHCGL